MNDSYHESFPQAPVFSLALLPDHPSPSRLLPNKLTSASDYLQAISPATFFTVTNSQDPAMRKPIKEMKGTYPLLALEEGEGTSNCVLLEEDDHLDHYAVYLGGALSAVWSSNKEIKMPCVTAVGQIIYQTQVIAQGTLVMLEDELMVLIDNYSINTYSCVSKGSNLQSIIINGTSHTFVSSENISEDPERLVNEITLMWGIHLLMTDG